MTMEQIDFFLMAVRCDTFLEAAENLHIAQSTLSKQIQKLEAELNLPLFDCSCSKFLSQILKIVVKNFSEMVPGKQTQKEGFRPLIFLTHSMRITLLIIIEFDPCIYAVKFNFIPFQVPLYQAADVIQNHT